MRAKKKVLHVISSLHRGGAETLLVMLVNRLTEYEHHVCYFHEGPLRSELENAGISLTRIKGFLAPYDPIGFYKLLKCVRRFKPDVIHTSLWAANLIGPYIGALCSVPVVSAFHTLCEHEGKLRTLMARFGALSPSRFIAVSDGVAQSLQRSGRAYLKEITLIPNGIDTYALTQKAQRPIAYKRDHLFTFGSVGRLVPVKNYTLLLESFYELKKQHNAIRLILVGNGPQESVLRMQAKRLGIEDAVLFIVNQEAAPYYHLFDCFVQPSLYEGLSLALLESMALGVPVITTSAHGQHDVIKHLHDGFLIKPNDGKALTDALSMVLTDDGLRQSFRKAAKITVAQNFTLDTTAANYDKILRQVMKAF